MQESRVLTSNVDQEIWSERWHLAALKPEDYIRISLLSVIIGLVFVIFHLQGNTTDVRAFGRSTIKWMLERWSASGGDMSHGYLIPFVSLGVLWHKRKEFFVATKKVSGWGLAALIGALLLHWIGAKAQQPRLSLLALIGVMWSVPFYFYGWQIAKRLIFICSYLIFCIPLNFLDSLTFPLRLFVTVISTALLNGLGIAVRRTGSAIYSLSASGFSLDVADPCSGLRSLLAMTALTAVYAYLTQKTLWKKWTLFLCSIPLAIVGNIIRITTVALVAEAYGQELAVGIYHDYSGYVFFSVAIGLMIAVGSLLNTNFTEAWEQWKKTHLHPTS